MSPSPVVYKRIISPGGSGATGVGIASEAAANIWSIMHLTQPFGCALPGMNPGITESDQNMFLGTYSGFDYV